MVGRAVRRSALRMCLQLLLPAAVCICAYLYARYIVLFIWKVNSCFGSLTKQLFVHTYMYAVFTNFTLSSTFAASHLVEVAFSSVLAISLLLHCVVLL